MKKRFFHVLTLVLLAVCLTACNFTKNISGAMASEPEAAPKVTEMMLALAENRTADAKALMHPQTAEASDSAIAQMRDYLAGRKAETVEQTSITVNTSTGTSGNIRQERVGYRVTLSDSTVIYLNVIYLSDSQGTGFAAFQVVLGVV